jgi:hypothetical protein
VEEKEDFGGIGVSFGESEEVKVVMADIKILKDQLVRFYHDQDTIGPPGGV